MILHNFLLTLSLCICYTEYVGAVSDRPFFCPAQQKEMTLDCSFFSNFFTVKGHFCSFLLSNIIGYLAFLDWTFPFFIILSAIDLQF